MGVCELCNISDADRKLLLYENAYWSIYLANKQDYVGRCIIVLKRHCGSLSELTVNEWCSFKDITSSVENMLKNELSATMFNWSCLMNDAYKSIIPNPHVHFHVRPRYAASVSIGDISFIDTDFAHHYNNKSENKLNEEQKNKLFCYLKQKIDIYFNEKQANILR